MPLRILVTGFEPFGDSKRNPSGDTAKALHKKMVKVNNLTGVVTGVVLPVLWDIAAKELDKAIKAASPHIVVSLGMADKTFRVEQLADDKRGPEADNAKVTPKERAAKKYLMTRLPALAVENAIRSVVGAKRVTSSSKDAGGFICNEVFFTLVKGYPELFRCGFIHTPSDAFVPEELKQSEVDDAIKAALVAIVNDLSPVEKIIADSTQGNPVDVEGEKKGDEEQAWLIDEKSWLAMLKLIPDKVMKGDPLLGLKIGDEKGWLAKKLLPVVIDELKSIPVDLAPPPPKKPKPGKNHTGLATYGDSYVLWRHAVHHNHEPHGGPKVDGQYDAMEGFKLTAEMAAKYVAANKL